MNLVDRLVPSAWEHHLTRPFSLLGASLWHAWYYSEALQDVAKVRVKNALFVEEHLDVTRFYMDRQDRATYLRAIERLARDEQETLRSAFREAFALNEQAREAIKEGANAFTALQDSVDFLNRLAIHATVLPNSAFPKLVEFKVDDEELKADAERLRGESLYSTFISSCVVPHAAKILNLDPESAGLVTLSELLKGTLPDLQGRREARAEGKHFVYQHTDDAELIEWVSDPRPVVVRLEGLSDSLEGVTELKGQIAYKGVARGRAVLVMSDSGKGVEFNDGDILISINSNPTLMPLIKKSAAIVTDEGGVSCHAAIVSRELKKPCVMGTKFATKVFKTGDLIEVNANEGIVRRVA